ncbi:RNase_H superfamily protein [Prosthecobacter debontii]|uniref:RNase_H superfamily protein n=1 Tax=Prosthecobacter debontii TaxID=48467 RepID=A0A1T4Y699_9BACT|nr:ribonuclease H-like domain-containing protein [Prosthecobacter debontii]SKA97240.1 RNase_H superfamily protein [Prosthecobacter debontii]
MARDIVYFDLETRRTANDVGGWGNKHKMGISVGVTYSTKLGEYRIYLEEEAGDLIHQLTRADLVVGFNHVSFDYEVLMGHTIFDFRDQVRDLDLLVDLEKKLGHRLKLEAVAAASLGTGKTADGLEAIRWWQQGKMAEIAEYCAFDVKVTKCVHEFGAKNGFVKYHDRNGREQQVEVDWTLD